MFHELTDKELTQRKRIRMGAVAVIAVIAIALVLVVNVVRANAREQGAVALRSSIISAAKQCCAIEGSYPTSLDHLEESYGLTVNHDDYIVTYEYFAGNIMPSVVVTPR